MRNLMLLLVLCCGCYVEKSEPIIINPQQPRHICPPPCNPKTRPRIDIEINPPHHRQPPRNRPRIDIKINRPPYRMA